MTVEHDHHARVVPAAEATRTRRERFVAGWTWFVLKNVVGWVLILAAFVAGPLVPGPGGIPLFLVGFALVSFPGKRRLTARVLRGRPFQFRGGPFVLVSLAVALTAPALALRVGVGRSTWLSDLARDDPAGLVLLYAAGAALLWALSRGTPHLLNALLRLVARARRAFRPWLRHHHIRLLPPRWRRRHAHEPGAGPVRTSDGILKFQRRRGRRRPPPP